ncbi:MAG: EpsG family protein [Oscillospiraceae bacterium]|nr:EpsG family protein [Oscillospiraceae bacterium]
MLVYYLLLIGSLAIGIPLCRLKHGKKIYCGLAGVALFLVAALRSGVGYDYNLYGNLFYQYQSESELFLSIHKEEKGFVIPVKYLAYATDDYQIMFVVIAAIITAAVMLYIYFYTEKAYLGVFCFLAFGVFFNSMCFMRQMIAASILLFAMQYIKKKQFYRFAVLVLFASVFHVSALVMLVFYFLLRIKMNWISLGVYSGILVLYFIFSEKALEFITKYVYTGYQLGSNAEITGGITPIYMIFFGIFFVLAFAVRKRLCEKDSFNNVLINCMFFDVFFEAMGAKHAVISRFAILFIIPAITVLVPQVITVYMELCKEKFGKNKKKLMASKAAVLAAFAVFCTGMYTFMIVNNYNGVYPYQTIFSERGTEDAEQ